MSQTIDLSEVLNSLPKYLMEGLAVGGAAMYLSRNKLNLNEVLSIGVVAALTFMILDLWAPNVGSGSRQGAGFGLGAMLSGFGFREGFDENGSSDDGSDAVLPEHVSAGPQLVDGEYAKKVIKPGYSETVRAANCHNLDRYLSFNGRGTVEGFADPPMGNIDDPKRRRVPGALHSGDLINIASDGRVLQRGTVNSQIIFDKPLPEVMTNLAKLRFVLKEHSNKEQKVINYGDSVLLMHNSFVNNRNKSFVVKYGNRLQSHQEGPLFRVFKLYSATDQAKKGPVKFTEPLLIARGDRNDEKIYLKIESDKSVTANAVVAEGDKMVLSLNRVFEYGNRNLCVGPNELLFP